MDVLRRRGGVRMNKKKGRLRKIVMRILSYAVLTMLGIVFVYPLLFMLSASFKTNQELMTSMSLIPKSISFDSYVSGWKGVGAYTFGHFMKNSAVLVIPVVAFTVMSSSLVAYGFARFRFKGHGFLFGTMLSTMMLPNAVVIVPRYIMFRQLGWLNTYVPFYALSLFACYPFFIFSMVQFIRGIPKDIDESAFMDGCSTFGIFIYMILPLAKPCLFSMAIFQFIWTWNDYFNPLIFINSVNRYTVMQGLRMCMDSSSGISWGPIMALSLIAILPCVIIFFAAQKYFVEGVATTGLKG